MTVALGLGIGLTVPAVAAADEGDQTVVVHGSTSDPLPQSEHLPPRGLELSIGRELTWSRMMLEETPPYSLIDGERLMPSVPDLLAGIDDRNDQFTYAPGAMSSIASVATSTLTSGLSLFEVWRDQRLRQRHSLRGFVRSNGVKLVWRIDF